MRLVWLFKTFYLIVRKFDFERGNGLIEMIHLGRADNGTVYIGFIQDPCQRDLGGSDTSFLRNFRGAVCHIEILFTEIQAFRKRIAVGAFCFAAAITFAISRKETTRHWAPGDESDTLLLAQRDHLAFLFTIDEVVMVLHRDELRPAVGFRNV